LAKNVAYAGPATLKKSEAYDGLKFSQSRWRCAWFERRYAPFVLN